MPDSATVSMFGPSTALWLVSHAVLCPSALQPIVPPCQLEQLQGTIVVAHEAIIVAHEGAWGCTTTTPYACADVPLPSATATAATLPVIMSLQQYLG